MKKTWSALFGLLLLVMPAAIYGQYSCSTNPDTTLTITNYSGAGGALVIPTNLFGLPVTAIGNQAFSSSTNLTGVTIGGSIAVIGNEAFAGCANLASVTISNSVTNIGYGVFGACMSLAAINVDAQNMFYSSTNGVLFNKGQTTLIAFPGGQDGQYTIPGTTTQIGQEAFFGCGHLTGLSIPGSVTNIATSGFELCTNLGSVVLPASITEIEPFLFYGCSALTNVVIPNGVTDIGGAAFDLCLDLGNIVLPASVSSIEESAFYNCTALTNIVIPSAVTNIGAAAFYDCSSLTNIVIPSGVTSIGAQVFALCSGLPTVVIPNGVTNIGFGAFFDATNLTSIVIPDNVSNLANYAFDQCSSLTNIVIPGSVTNIGDYAFESCSNLTSVNFTGNAPAADLTVFTSDTNVAIYYLPGTTGWNNNFAGLAATAVQYGSLQVTINPSTAITAGAEWQADGGAWQSSGATLTNLSAGTHTLSFNTISNSTTPPSQNITITNGLTTIAVGFYAPDISTPDGLILLTNGFGTIQHSTWPTPLKIGKKYTVTATPKSKNVFTYWFGGTNEPYGILSESAHYTFTMQSNLLVEANFVTNLFLTGAGAYTGLFAPDTTERQQTNSGSFAFNVTTTGAVGGSLDLGGQTVPFSGKFNPDGVVQLISKRAHGEPAVTTILQLNFSNQSVTGIVSDGSFTATLTGNRNAFSAANKATAFEGQYTFIIPGTTNSAIGPFGTSYGTVKVTSSGSITLVGSLADGTPITQSSQISRGGFWPLYIKLYNANGSLWGWNYFTNHTVVSLSGLSWINVTNSNKAAVYRSGFTNQTAALLGGLYVPGQPFPSDLAATFEETNPSLTNTLTNFSGLKIVRTTGIVSGDFANPSDPAKTIKFNGIILQGQTNVQGFFLNGTQSGSVSLTPSPNP